MFWVVLIVVILLAGIIVLSGSPLRTKTRQEFLRDLERFLEGRLEAVKDQPDSFRIRFTFAGETFFYEDVSEKGFRVEAYKAYLKVPTSSRFTFSFIEKQPVTTIKSEVLIASKIPDEPPPAGEMKVAVPEKLKGLDVHTNNPRFANEFLKDGRIVTILAALKNADTRGYSSVPFRIIDGVVILEFSAIAGRNPCRANLLRSISSIDEYLEKLLKIVKILKALEEEGSAPSPNEAV